MLLGTPKNPSIAQRLILETFPLSNYFLFKNAPRKFIIIIIAFITSPFSFLLNMCQVHTSPSILLLTALSSSCIHYQFFNFVFLIYSSRDRQIYGGKSLQRSTNTFFCFTFLKEDCDRDELCLFWCFDMKRKLINKKVTKVTWLEFENNNKSIWKSRWC